MRSTRLAFKKCSWELGRLVRFGNSPGWTRPEHRRYVRSPPTPPTLGLGDEVAEWPENCKNRFGTKVRQGMRPADNAPVAVLQATWVLGDTRPESVYLDPPQHGVVF